MNKLTITFASAIILAALPHMASAISPIVTQQINHYSNLQASTGRLGRMELTAQAGQKSHVMGYTDQAVDAEVEMPANMKSWLDCVNQAAEYVNAHPEYTLGTASASSIVINPLLGGIKWNQDYPYNNFCPSGTPVGCVATAMAQVLYFYRYPEHGFNKKSYTQGSYTLSADFENTYYQWDNMFDTFINSCTDEQKTAVAELSYHCGVAANMNYAPEGSGAWLERVPHALQKYFGYNSKAAVRNRCNYAYEDWSEMMISELQAGRPIIFAANSSDVGHCFVIDGINAEGLFHVNWGWGGHYNGYFDIGILNPHGTGIGGSQEDFGYCFGQGAVMQLCPEEGLGEDICPITCSQYGLWENENGGFEAGYTFQNNSGSTVKATVGIEIFDMNGNTCLYLPGHSYEFAAYPSRGYWQWDIFQIDNVSSLPDGTYTLGGYCLIPALDSTYFRMDSRFDEASLVFDIENGVIVNSDLIPSPFRMSASNLNLEAGQVLAVGKIYNLTFDVTNESDYTFVGQAYAYFERVSTDNPTQWEFGSEDLKILPGETRTVRIPAWLEERGEWGLYVIIYDYGYEATIPIQFEGCEQFTAEFTSESPASLKLADTPQLLTERCEVDGDVAFAMTVDNEGGQYNDNIAMMLFANKTSTENPVLVIEAPQNLEMLTPGNAVSITGKLDGLKGMTKYFARPFYQDRTGQYVLLPSNNGKTSPIEVKVYNSTGIDQVLTDQSDNAPVYDLMGRRIQQGQGRGIHIRQHAASLR